MESIGQTLKAARERKRASLSFVASQTRIKLQFLELMERDEFARLPAPAYAKGFLRMYAEYLGLEAQPLVQQYLEVHVGQRPPRLQSARNEPERPAVPVAARPPRREAVPASAPKASPPPAPEPAVDEPADVPAPAPSPRPRPPRKPWIAFKKPDFSRLQKSLAAWPWGMTAGVVAAVVAVVLLANGLARWARRADGAPVVNRPLVLKKGVPAVLQDVPEPYLSLPAEPTENAR
jgi:hypothetical protein